jgi:hypothetical protein
MSLVTQIQFGHGNPMRGLEKQVYGYRILKVSKKSKARDIALITMAGSLN